MSGVIELSTDEMNAVASAIKTGAEEMKGILGRVDSSHMNKIRDMQGGNLLKSLVASWDEIKIQIDKIVADSADKSSQEINTTGESIITFFDQSIVS